MTNNTPANDTKKFSGICQVCGRRQAVNAKGNIAKHGYTLDYGFFNGTCPGSDALPFEQSKELAERIITSVHDHANQLVADAVILEAPAVAEEDGSWMAWVHEYRAPSWDQGNRSGGYFWHRAKVVSFDSHDSHDGGKFFSTLSYVAKFETRTGKTTKSAELRNYSDPVRSEQDAVTRLNASYGAALRRNAEQQREWIKWQEERCASWMPKALEPRK